MLATLMLQHETLQGSYQPLHSLEEDDDQQVLTVGRAVHVFTVIVLLLVHISLTAVLEMELVADLVSSCIELFQQD